MRCDNYVFGPCRHYNVPQMVFSMAYEQRNPGTLSLCLLMLQECRQVMMT